jgi:hypothetical protein
MFIIIIIVRNIIFKLYLKIIKGIIFCRVKIIKQILHFCPSITSGNQKWNGADPNFINREELIIIVKLI